MSSIAMVSGAMVRRRGLTNSPLGFKVKELLGGLDWWRRDGHATASGLERSTLSEQKRRVSTP